MVATTRMLTLSALFAMILGLMLVHPAGAEPKPTKPPYPSVERRVELSEERCMEDGGGKSWSAEYIYNPNGSLGMVKTKCKGGTYGGQVCEFTSSTTNCVTVLEPGEQSDSPNAPIGDGVLEEAEVTTSPTHGDLSGGTLATPEAGSSRTTVRTDAAQATAAQANDDEQP